MKKTINSREQSVNPDDCTLKQTKHKPHYTPPLPKTKTAPSVLIKQHRRRKLCESEGAATMHVKYA